MKTVNDIEKAGRDTWLAGIGASSAGWQQATDAFDKAYTETNSLFNELIERGEKVDAKLREKFNVKAFVEQKVIKFRAAMGLDKPSKEEQLDNLSEKVDALMEVVVNLAAERKVIKAAKADAAANVKKAEKLAEKVEKIAEKAEASNAKPAPAKKAAPKAAAKPKAKKNTPAK